MASSFEIELVNGEAGDPAVAVYLQQLGETILFDAGTLDKLSNKEILKIQTVCISHTHVDHFIGFDRIIRVHIPHFRTITVIGPTGIASQVRSKLLAYTWNLLESNQINYRIFEVAGDLSVTQFDVSSDRDFDLNQSEVQPPSLLTNKALIPLGHSKFEIHATILDHGTNVCGFALKLPDTQAVSTDALQDLGIAPGPWIGDLQRRSGLGLKIGDIKLADGSIADGDQLAQKILSHKLGKKIVYLTDLDFSNMNLDKIRQAFSDCDVLVCETNYRDEHRFRAFQKKHLTTKHAALIAATIRSRALTIFHISNIYAGDITTSQDEAKAFFESFRKLDANELHAAVCDETLNCIPL